MRKAGRRSTVLQGDVCVECENATRDRYCHLGGHTLHFEITSCRPMIYAVKKMSGALRTIHIECRSLDSSFAIGIPEENNCCLNSEYITIVRHGAIRIMVSSQADATCTHLTCAQCDQISAVQSVTECRRTGVMDEPAGSLNRHQPYLC